MTYEVCEDIYSKCKLVYDKRNAVSDIEFKELRANANNELRNRHPEVTAQQIPVYTSFFYNLMEPNKYQRISMPAKLICVCVKNVLKDYADVSPAFIAAKVKYYIKYRYQQNVNQGTDEENAKNIAINLAEEINAYCGSEFISLKWIDGVEDISRKKRIDDVQDFETTKALGEDRFNAVSKNIEVEPQDKKEPLSGGKGEKYYPRDRKISKIALARSGFVCENPNCNCPVFKRRSNSKINYTEPHHLIPLSRYEEFEYSLDNVANIVSLCSSCHNEIHYGVEFEKILIALYDLRRGELDKAKIHVDLEQLIKMYS